MPSRGRSTDQPEFVFPAEINSEMDQIALNIIRALFARNFASPNLTVEFKEWSCIKGDFVAVRSILGPGFGLFFDRMNNLDSPLWHFSEFSRVAANKTMIQYYEDNSGPALYLYGGRSDWNRVAHGFEGYDRYPRGVAGYERRRFSKDHGIDWPLRILEDKRLHNECVFPVPDSYYISDRFSKSPPKTAKPEVSLSEKTKAVYDWLQSNVLLQITTAPEQKPQPDLFSEPLRPWPHHLGRLYTLLDEHSFELLEQAFLPRRKRSAYSLAHESSLAMGIKGGTQTRFVLGGTNRRNYDRHTGAQARYAMSTIEPRDLDALIPALRNTLHDPCDGGIRFVMVEDGEIIPEKSYLIAVKPKKSNGIFLFDNGEKWGGNVSSLETPIDPDQYRGEFQSPWAMPLRDIHLDEITIIGEWSRLCRDH